ncbi:hypothetical protein CANINC_002734 [Pichia inconspicua]|uniref:GDS1 winged helix domain-containing protein n=1 Tax=Pichia inconspicua TaxID=52247 RepID=A0A4T0X0G1_9ASCO|nr:hypothetical protein CANINC_002734 [[Candida] inconspicua]
MSQDHIASSEELSDFNTDKSNTADSVPTSPENNGKLSNQALNLSPTPESFPDSKDSKLEKKDKKEKKEKKEKKAARTINFASGISTSVPLTGDRPKPENHASMEDDVLLAIFVILYENDTDSKGMTVKQICDVLLEKHSNMSTLSSKTSNLVSAKLNAYVKKVEKGDSSIHYALSRDWADSSPKRMVYVYRGILSPDYPAYVQTVINKQKEAAASQININESEKPDFEADLNDANLVYTSKLKAAVLGDLSGSLASNPTLAQDFSGLQSISPSGLQLNKSTPFGNGSIDFEIPQLSVPYAVAPVTASLNISMPINNNTKPNSDRLDKITSDFAVKKNQYLSVIPDSDSDDDVYSALKAGFGDDEVNDDDYDAETSIYENHGYYRHGADIITERIPSGVSKRSKSISFMNKRSKSTTSPSSLNSDTQRSSSMSDSRQKRVLTAAALTPRVPRKSFANTPHAAAAVAALRAVALGPYNGTINDSFNSITTSIMSDTSIEPSISAKWLETVRSGFLNQEIESPENVSLAELDTLFT